VVEAFLQRREKMSPESVSSELTPLVMVNRESIDYREGFLRGRTVGCSNCTWRTVGLVISVFSAIMMAFNTSAFADPNTDNITFSVVVVLCALSGGGIIGGMYVGLCGPCDHQEID